MRRKVSIDSVLEQGEDFRHVIIPAWWRETFGPHNMRIVALAELIKSAMAFGALERVLVDGHLSAEELTELRRALQPSQLPSVRHGPNFDTTYPLVNRADRLANLLYRYYSCPGVEATDYVSRLVTPKIEDYRFFFRQAG